MKSVLMSIRPNWCELIANGKKTVEVRKTKPKLETPFKVYIYCTQEKGYNDILWCSGVIGRMSDKANGKVIGEFICEQIEELSRNAIFNAPALYSQSCMTREEYFNYIGDKTAYIWHISDLKIYDKPKELEEFNKPFPFSYICLDCEINQCSCKGYNKEYCDSCDQFKHEIKRSPQSWCYVEEI